MTNPIDIFIRRILQSDDDQQQIAWHEAGHRTMWRLLRPGQPTHYARRSDGLPACIPDNPADYKIADMPAREAGKMMAIKLGGIAAEMLKLGIQGDADIIAAWIAADWCAPAGASRIDWDDDIAAGGDISDAIRIIEIHGAANQATIHANLARVLAQIADIFATKPEFQEEKEIAIKFFNRRGKHEKAGNRKNHR